MCCQGPDAWQHWQALQAAAAALLPQESRAASGEMAAAQEKGVRRHRMGELAVRLGQVLGGVVRTRGDAGVLGSSGGCC